VRRQVRALLLMILAALSRDKKENNERRELIQFTRPLMECHEFLLFSGARGDAPFGFVCGALHSSLRAIGLSAQLDHKTVLN
jgi:hypothetical protein